MFDFWGSNLIYSSIIPQNNKYIFVLEYGTDEYIQWQVSNCREVLPTCNLCFIKWEVNKASNSDTWCAFLCQ